ncbi:hypothetical protein [Propionivibrio soli]|uniref:hypothetical protein n=1 Tax=Propionivibrio soli TaxID=2976531 RepID=UPI0021E76260|nr:hypothetical protein [Propionivibrio soli]
MASDFYKYFSENMEALGLPAPETLYGNLQLALANVTAMAKYVDQFGTKVTVMEMARAGSRLERLATVGAVSAAFYVGAVIGSIAIATGRSLAGGTTISDALSLAANNNIGKPWVRTALVRYPGILDSKVAHRATYRFMAAV